MPKITLIQAQKKAGRYNIYLDGTYAFPVAESVLIKYQLAKGMEIDKQLLSQITSADLQAKAYNKALDYLSHQLRTQKELSDHLKELGIDEPTIKEVLTKLLDLRLLDDQVYANSFVRTQANLSDKGPTVIRQKLRQKGIGENLIDRALLEFPLEAQVANAKKLGQKLAKRHQASPLKIRQNKIITGIMTKGFSASVANSALEQLDLQVDPNQELPALTTKAKKAWRRYQRFDLKTRQLKTKQALYRKGFNLDEIDKVLAELAE